MILEKGNKKLHPPPDKNALLKSYRSKQGKHVKKLQSFTSEYIFRFVTIPPSFCHSGETHTINVLILLFHTTTYPKHIQK